MNPNYQNETKSDVFHGTYSNLTKFLICRKILKHLNDFHHWHFPISLQKQARTSKVKQNQTEHVQI